MRNTLLLLLVLSSFANAEDAVHQWTIHGQLSPKANANLPIAQKPFLVNDDLLIISFSPDYIMGVDPGRGLRLWEWPFFNDADRSNQNSSSDREPAQVWGLRGIAMSVDTERKLVFSLDRNGTLAALDWSDEGRLKWQTGGPQSTASGLSNFIALGVPCIHAGSALYLALDVTRLVLVEVDSATGEFKSQTHLTECKAPIPQHPNYSPMTYGNRIVVPLPTNQLFVINLVNHKVIQRINADGMLDSAFQLAFRNDVVAIFSRNRCQTYDLNSGLPSWSRKSLAAHPFVPVDDKLIIQDGGSLRCLAFHSGAIEWETNLSTNVIANGMLHGELLLLPSKTGIQALRLRDGAHVTTQPTSIPLGHLFSISGNVYSVSASRVDKLSLTILEQ